MDPEKAGKKKYSAPTLTRVTADRWEFPLRERPLPVTHGLRVRTGVPGGEDCRIALSSEGKFKKVSCATPGKSFPTCPSASCASRFSPAVDADARTCLRSKSYHKRNLIDQGSEALYF